MKAIGFNAGQFGDVIMGTVAARAHKLQYPDSYLTCGIADKYCSISPLFERNKYFDAVHIWEGYNNWPTSSDSLTMSRFDKVYDAMPDHTDPFWYLKRHQTAELCMMHGLTPPDNLQVELSKTWKVFSSKKYIGLSLFGETRGGDKNISEKKAREIVRMIKKMGYTPMQFGLPSHPKICDDFIASSFFNSVALMTDTRLLITIDTAMSWIASGFSHPTIGLYGYSYYTLAKTSKNWQPINPNAIYIESRKAEDIILEDIEKAIKEIK